MTLGKGLLLFIFVQDSCIMIDRIINLLLYYLEIKYGLRDVFVCQVDKGWNETLKLDCKMSGL